MPESTAGLGAQRVHQILPTASKDNMVDKIKRYTADLIGYSART